MVINVKQIFPLFWNPFKHLRLTIRVRYKSFVGDLSVQKIHAKINWIKKSSNFQQKIKKYRKRKSSLVHFSYIFQCSLFCNAVIFLFYSIRYYQLLPYIAIDVYNLNIFDRTVEEFTTLLTMCCIDKIFTESLIEEPIGSRQFVV